MDESPRKIGKFRTLCTSANSVAGFVVTVLTAVVSLIAIVSWLDGETTESATEPQNVPISQPPVSKQLTTPRIDTDSAALNSIIAAKFAEAGTICQIDDLLLTMESAAVTQNGDLTGHVWDYTLSAAVSGTPVGLTGQVNALAKTATGARRDALDRIALKFLKLPKVIGECDETTR